MKKDYSVDEMKKIMGQDMEVPKSVDEGMKKAYEQLGIQTTRRHNRKYKLWTGLAAAAVLTAGLSITAFAVTKYLNVTRSEEGETLQYQIEVDTKQKEAHQIKVEPTYMPDGYEYQEEGPYGGKWHNKETNSVVSIIPYNAAELYKMSRVDGDSFRKFRKESRVKTSDTENTKRDLFLIDSEYVDSDKTEKMLYLFNEEEGYGIYIHNTSDLPQEEIEKVAEGLKVTVLDETVPYPSEEEIQAEIEEKKQSEEKIQAIAESIVPAENVCSVGEEIKNPFRDEESPESEDIRFTVKDIKIQDTLPVDQFPRENYAQYEEEVALWVNEDTSLKPHERYVFDAGEEITTGTMANKETETVNSKYVVVKMQAENCSDFQTEWNASGGISIAPDLAYMKTNEDGSLSRADYQLVRANENYGLQWEAGNGASFPIYFDKIYYTEGVQRMKDAFFRPLAAGETLEYTLVYVADEDQLDSLYLNIYPGYGSTEEAADIPYVKVK
ncbi:MAG: DUF4367 domain-containing protein [[Ruminococcus] gnavus]|nr:DUF4367 domain-containing protein [Mediterraneibacter gnavus]